MPAGSACKTQSCVMFKIMFDTLLDNPCALKTELKAI